MPGIREASILDSIKLMLGVDSDYDVYDNDIVTHINGALFELFQLGVGIHVAAYEIEGSDEKWSDFMGNEPNFMAVKNFVYMRVSLDFDPPTSSFAIDAKQRRIQELAWRLNAQHDRPAIAEAVLVEGEV